MKALFRRCAIPAALLIAWAAPATGADDAARLAPPDTLVLFSLADLSVSKQRLQQTALGALYRDEAMRPFVASLEKGVPRLLEEKVRETWEELGMEDVPADLPWPTGRVVLLARLKRGQRQVTEYDWQNWDGQGQPPVKERGTEPTTEVRGLVLADLGDRLDTARRLAERLTRVARDKGWRLRREDARGTEMMFLTPPEPEGDEGEGAPPSDRALIYAFEGTTLLVCPQARQEDLEYCADILARLGGAERPSLADDADYRLLSRKVGQGDLQAYLNVKHLLRWLVEQAEGMAKAQRASMMNVLGVENVTGLALSIRLAPDERIDVRNQAVIGIRGPRRGIPALLMAEPRSTEPGPLLTEGLAGFLVANYDLGELYEGIRSMVQQAAGVDLDVLAQQGLSQVTVDGGPPIDLRKDLLEKLTGPVVLLMKVNRPYDAPDASRWQLNVGVRDGSTLDAALARLHGLAFAGQDEARRELRGRTVYMLPSPMAQPGGEGMAFAIAGGNFVFGMSGVVEQSIRNLDREDVASIARDPMYRHAARHLPSRATIFSYENHRQTVGPAWEQLRAAARRRAEEAEGAAGDGEDDHEVQVRVSTSGMPVHGLAEALGDEVDFGLLPEYDRIRDHWGAQVSSLTECEEGILLENITVKPPAE